MTKEMMDLIDKYWDEDKHDRIVELVMAVPEKERDIDMLGQLVVAYNNLGRYDDAIALSMKLRDESAGNAAWHYRIAYAYIGKEAYQRAIEHIQKGLALAKKTGDTSRERDLQNLYVRCLPHLSEGRAGMEIKNEPLQIVWSGEDGEYKVIKGVVKLGYIGIFHCHQISVNFGEAFCGLLFSKGDYVKNGLSLKDYIAEHMSHEEYAKGLTDFFNARVQEITEHIVQINQAFLAYLMLDMCNCEYPFWEDCPSLVIPEKMPETENIGSEVYTREVFEKVNGLYDRYYEMAMNGAVDDTPWAEEFIEKYLPMFDYRKMLDAVYAEYMSLEPFSITFQCSGKGEALRLVCGAYAEILNDISFFDWHNH